MAPLVKSSNSFDNEEKYLWQTLPSIEPSGDFVRPPVIHNGSCCDDFLASFLYDEPEDEEAALSVSMLEFGPPGDGGGSGGGSGGAAAAKVFLSCRRFFKGTLMLAAIAAWLGCSFMNSSAMKDLEYSVRMRHYEDKDQHRQDAQILSDRRLLQLPSGSSRSTMLHSRLHDNVTTKPDSSDLLSHVVAITAIVTAAQLFFGAVLGCILVYMLSYCRGRPATADQVLKNCIWMQSFRFLRDKQSASLIALHALSSAFSNLGFMHDDASLVLTLKLLEPFETLVLTNVCMGGSKQENTFTIGVVSSLVLTVGAAFFAIQNGEVTAHSDAVVFALFAGITLSARNVFQRGQTNREDEESTTHSQVHRYAVDVRNGTPSLFMRTTMRLEDGLIHFASLSLQASIFMAAIAIILYCGMYSTSLSFRESADQYRFFEDGERLLGLDIVLWYPLYSAFSIVALRFCSALTHSLISASQGAANMMIEVAVLNKSLSPAHFLSACMVSVGVCWYIVETTKKAVHRRGSSSRYLAVMEYRHGTRRMQSRLARWSKPLIALLLLNLVATFSSMKP